MAIEWSRVDFVGFLYAALVAFGGIFGYIKAQSVPSLAAGLTFGILLAIGAYLISFFDPPKPLLQLIVAIVLACLMGYRFYGSGKIMPAGLICFISIGVTIWNIIAHRQYLPLIGDK